ncbi:hypothetical protein ACMXYX_06945 [Neptuniibacter sp. QD72_48]|uniref:hypothetical protein n=1 Tax=Neptuniibacter sp. QD72_48 TaxID=3398214 RepID=UPI0039F5C22F
MRSFLTLLLLISSHLSADTLSIGVHANYVNEHFKLAAGRAGYSNVLPVKECPELDSEQLKGSQRITMDIMVICNAVKSAKYVDLLRLVPYPNVARGLQLANNNKIDMVGQSLFEGDHRKEENLLITHPVIRIGEFQVGIFSTKNRTDILELGDSIDVTKLRGVTVKSWKTDQAALNNIGAKQVNLLPTRNLIANFISSGRGDFTLSYLKEPVVTRIGGELIRIPGVKVSFDASRSFILPARNTQLFNILQSYIKEQRQKSPDAIRQAYIHAGFITEDYDHWRDLAK